MRTTEQELMWAAMNYLSYRAQPDQFTGEPIFLLAEATFASLRAHDNPDAKTQLASLERLYPPEKMKQLHNQIR